MDTPLRSRNRLADTTTENVEMFCSWPTTDTFFLELRFMPALHFFSQR